MCATSMMVRCGSLARPSETSPSPLLRPKWAVPIGQTTGGKLDDHFWGHYTTNDTQIAEPVLNIPSNFGEGGGSLRWGMLFVCTVALLDTRRRAVMRPVGRQPWSQSKHPDHLSGLNPRHARLSRRPAKPTTWVLAWAATDPHSCSTINPALGDPEPPPNHFDSPDSPPSHHPRLRCLQPPSPPTTAALP